MRKKVLAVVSALVITTLASQDAVATRVQAVTMVLIQELSHRQSQ